MILTSTKAFFNRFGRLGRDSVSLVQGRAFIVLGDARKLEGVRDREFDLAVTSPPYLNAIDYMRGHRMTLVWLGYDLARLRATRAANIGAERALEPSLSTFDVGQFIVEGPEARLSERHYGWVRRFASDMHQVIGELRRVVKPGGRIVLVVANSFIRGATINNSALIESIARVLELDLAKKHSRDIPARRRYLPPPGEGRDLLDARMRKEAVLTFNVK